MNGYLRGSGIRLMLYMSELENQLFLLHNNGIQPQILQRKRYKENVILFILPHLSMPETISIRLQTMALTLPPSMQLMYACCFEVTSILQYQALGKVPTMDRLWSNVSPCVTETYEIRGLIFTTVSFDTLPQTAPGARASNLSKLDVAN